MNTSTISIREAALADLNTLVAVARQSTYEAFGPEKYPGNPIQDHLDEAVTAAVYAREFTNRRASFWLAETDTGEPAGFIRLIRHAPPRRMIERNALEIERIYLLDRYVGQGYGKQLMAHCLDQARAQGCRAVWLGVWEHNEVARTFYQKMGFIPFGWHIFTIGTDPQRDIWMWREV